jgi:hypothetical protein
MMLGRMLFPLALFVSVASCVAATGDPDGEELESEEPREAESAQVGVDCGNRRTATGYKSGSPFTITIVDADGKPIELNTAGAYARMQTAAARAGISLRVVSGFRTYAQQQALYDDYRAGRGNLAARPGYSNHQSGHALDLNSSAPGVYSWLAAHAGEYGFARTVPSEPWHWEYWGGATGACETTTTPPPSSGCWSSTLGKNVPIDTCVQSRSDRKWYQCLAGNRWEIRWDVAAACVSEHPL